MNAYEYKERSLSQIKNEADNLHTNTRSSIEKRMRPPQSQRTLQEIDQIKL